MVRSLTLLALLLHVAVALISTHQAAHYSDLLRLKCDQLPYRTLYLEQNCFIVIDAPLDVAGAQKQCSVIYEGAKLAKNAPDAVWSALFADRSRFLQADETSGFKKAMCIFENKFRCFTGSTTSIPGRCMHKSDEKMTYRQAENFCSRVGSLPSPVTDLENGDVAATVKKGSAWLRPAHSKSWTSKTDFSRFGTCSVQPFYTASDSKWSSEAVAAATNAADGSRGYWTLAEQKSKLDVLCIGDAETDFWTEPPKTETKTEEEPPKLSEECLDEHRRDPKTKRCEWIGDRDVCVKLFNLNNNFEYIRIPSYPKGFPGVDVDFHSPNVSAKFKAFGDETPRAIVRNGCMATFWSHPLKGFITSEMKILSNVEYGNYSLPTEKMGTVESHRFDGLSRVSCYCDIFETEKEKLPKKECVDYHKWDDKKERCVWNGDDNCAGEIRNHEGKPIKLVIPNWPFNKRYDVNLKDANQPNFLYKVTHIVVRQGCFCTIYSGQDLKSWQPRATINYGSHGVASKFAENPLTRPDMGAMRVVCECMNGDSGKERLISNPKKEPCIEKHEYNEKTKQCEWTGLAHGCLLLTNTRGETMERNLIDWPKYAAGVTRFYNNQTLKAKWDKQLTWVTVRRGCDATVYASYYNKGEKGENYMAEYKILEQARYGTYRVPQKSFGDVEGGFPEMGASQVNCVCDAAQLPRTPASKGIPCLLGHKYEEKTGQCEWKGDAKVCATIRNGRGEEMELKMPNWPLQKRMNWNLKAGTHDPKSKDFYKTVTGVLIRQHCTCTMYSDEANSSRHTLVTSVYGNHTVKAGTVRIVCGCFD